MLEVLLRAALLLWLIHHTARCLSALVRLKKEKGRVYTPALCATLLLTATLFGVIISDPAKLQLVICILAVLSVSSLLVGCCFLINKSIIKEKAP
ncbi:MAG: hypothetical protein D3924_15845 [Candidatus Electrothrix sp. AR4]|nr:hypothetical protein [Candidatus Electrothrix sp. AR4]